MQCSIAKALDLVGDPWTMLVVRDALLGVRHFAQFQRRLGIPRATLTARLERLCADGVLRRSGDGSRVVYEPTDMGLALQPVVLMLMRWGDAWLRDDPPPTQLVERGSGLPVEPVLVDRATGRELATLDVVAVGPVTEGIGTDRVSLASRRAAAGAR
jgi:DNA-binding HxlR family transcriptional regulator